MQLANKTAIITGSSHGIGRAVARRFASEGAKLVIADIDDDAGHQLVKELTAAGSQAHYVHADVGEKLDVHNLIASSMESLSRIDILVNNAGIAISGEFLTLPFEDFEKVLRINLTGSFLCSQEAARHMVEHVKQGGAPGCIINMSSTNAKLAIPTQIPYTISKGGVRQLTNVLAQSLAPHGIRVNAIGPGSIDTRMLSSINSTPESMQRLMSRTPLSRLGTPEDIAAIAVFLASDESAYITGQTIYADGGRLGLAYTVPPPEVD